MGSVLILIISVTLLPTIKSESIYPSYDIKSDVITAHTFDGLGAISGGGATSKLLNTYPDSYRSDLYDLLFKPSFGASLQMLKVEMGGGAQTTEGTELSHMPTPDITHLNTFSYEWQVLYEAKLRNPSIKLIGLPWSFPGWVSDGLQNPFLHMDRLSSYYISWLDLARKNNLTIDYLGIWNEPPDSLIPYIANFTKYLRRELDKTGRYQHVKLIVGDVRQWNITQTLLDDKEFYASVDILSSHYPGEVSDPLARGSGKTLWASEDYSTVDNGHGAACLARIINRNFVKGGMTSTIAWNMIASYYNSLPYPQSGLMTANQPWTGHYTISPPLWVMAHTTQFTEIGWKYLPVGQGSYNLKYGGTVVSYLSPDRSQLTIVIETMSHKVSDCVRPHTPPYNVSTQNITLRLNGKLAKAISNLRYWRSKITPNSKDCSMMIKNPDIMVTSGVISLSDVPVNTLITLTTKRTGSKGTPKSQIPDGELFPLSYSDGFEPIRGLKVGNEPDYLTAQTGTFQLGKFRNRSVLIQTTYIVPVEFCSSTPYKTQNFPVKVAPVAVMLHNAYAYPNHSYTISVDMAIDSKSAANETDPGMFIGLYMSEGGCHVPLSSGVFFVFNVTRNIGGVYNKLNFTHENLIRKFEYKFEFDVFYEVRIVVANSSLQHLSINDDNVLVGLDLPKSGGLLGIGCNGFYKCMYDNLVINPINLGNK